MEEQNRYYTPDISELYIGYKCDVMWNVGYDYTWEPYTIQVKDAEGVYGDLSFVFEMYDDMSTNIRTKYLDKEDIESCGWTCQEYTQNGYNQRYTKNVDSESGYDLIYCAAWGGKWQINDCGYGIYWGEIKSINELKKIMKWLKIK